jgi:3-hydroxyisobutyrate dehydrogenase
VPGSGRNVPTKRCGGGAASTVAEMSEPDPKDLPIGMVGLGNMGHALAVNLVRSGLDVVAHDAAGPGRAPDGATEVGAVEAIAQRCRVVVLSLPDATASEDVARVIAGAPERATTLVVDTSTIGVRGASYVSDLLGQHGLEYVDAPVSGGVAGARARTLMIMFAGADGACSRAEPVLGALSDRRCRVGARPGMAQAVKLANNFLSATALVAASEAISFGRSVGVDMKTMLDVLNMSSGQSAATLDKFPNHIANGRYASGFTNTLMAKDVQLYLNELGEHGTSSVIGPITAEIWRRFAVEQPGADFTRIFPFVEGS